MGIRFDELFNKTKMNTQFKSHILALQSEYGALVQTDVLLAPFTTFKIGGPADVFLEAKTTHQLISFVKKARSLSLPLFILGGGTNLLIADKGIRGLVIKNSTKGIKIRGVVGSEKSGKSAKKAYVEADSGVLINSLVRYTVEEGLDGLQMHLGLPGTVGGAVYMNSKWTKPVGYVGDCVYSATLLSSDGTIRDEPKNYFQFAYDYSILHTTPDILLTVTFEMPVHDSHALWEIANSSIFHRRETQPQGVKSAGCIFKNISKELAVSQKTPEETTSAGYLIDSVGLKGIREGDAKISDQHANFIVNMGKATASDVLQLINRAKDQVNQRYGIVLEEEVIRVGEF